MCLSQTCTPRRCKHSMSLPVAHFLVSHLHGAEVGVGRGLHGVVVWAPLAPRGIAIASAGTAFLTQRGTTAPDATPPPFLRSLHKIVKREEQEQQPA